MSLNDKIELFFHDYSLVPLFAYENYIGAIPYSSRSLLLCAVIFIDHVAGEIICLIACMCVCVRPFVCGCSPV